MNIKETLMNLLKVKTIVTLVVILVFAVLALRGDITPDNVMNIVLIVVGFYFGTQHEKKVAVPAEAVEAVQTEVIVEGE